MSDGLKLRFLGVNNATAHELGNAAAVLEDDAAQTAADRLRCHGAACLPGSI